MPISEPYIPKGNAPQSLAFEDPAGAQASYQTTVTVNETVTRVTEEIEGTGFVTQGELRDEIRELKKCIMESEQRAKEYANGWHNAFQWAWDSTASPDNITFNTWWPMRFPREIQRGAWAEDNGTYWQFKPTVAQAGTYYIGCHLQLEHSQIAQVASTQVAVFVGATFAGELVPPAGRADSENNTTSYHSNYYRYGGILVNARADEYIRIYVKITSIQSNDSYYTGSIGGYVHGFRVACHGIGTEYTTAEHANWSGIDYQSTSSFVTP